MTADLDPVALVEGRLRELRYQGRILRSQDTIHTVDDAARTVGVEPRRILKSILVMDQGELKLALMCGPNRLDLKKMARLMGVKRLRMATFDEVVSMTPFKPGGVPPLGYPVQPPAAMDQDLFHYDVVWAAAGDDHSFFPVSPGDLRDYTQALVGEIAKA
ncbi:aminoacyl-tRNA deacylase [Thermanaerovibrio acidaminovorans]|uniref:aminoacyl-tRNA deacylase n=1 Tax=Thermanaerovibrio acidaminovorans TaxID=81462 RepID=UPI00249218AA|nr:YbaK/EbsC family protein [Thermanaerovibrio acidaminovorans]